MATTQTTIEVTTTNRPENCDCDRLSGALPCWACYRAGYKTQP